MTMRIEGRRREGGGLQVWIDGAELTPERSLNVCNHSPSGFECGYGGSGPAQLALAILLAAGLSDELATARHQDFKFQFVAGWQAPFDVTVDPMDWSRRVKKRRRVVASR